MTLREPDPMASEPFTVAVECVTDPTGEAVPCRFGLGGRRVEVVETLDRWPGTGYVYHKLRGSDGATYILRRDTARDRWQLVLFVRGAAG
jgi:hypothetical protein